MCTREKLFDNRPVLYWATLAAMFAAFVTVTLS